MEAPRAITTTQSEVLHMVLHMRNEEEGTPEESTPLTLIRELAAILIAHEADRSRDDLSAALWTQGREFVLYVAENCSKSFNELLQGAIPRIENLKRVLISEITEQTLWDPWLSQGVVLEKATLDARQLPIGDAVPHVFAKKMITWLTKIPLQNGTQMNPYVSRKEEKKLKKYEKMVGQVRFINSLKLVNAALVIKLQETNQRRDQDLLRMEQSCLQQTEELRRGLNNITSQQKETVTMLNERNNETQGILGIVKNDLAQTKFQLTDMQRQLADAWSCIHSHRAQIADLNDQVNNSSSCSIM